MSSALPEIPASVSVPREEATPSTPSCF
ncbi:hypothetical protein CCACVL1_27654 [Corchorus capsularis]|uniref:Uncharacterized protein n=1 Tax=Corchorus capsularis TaxID=210143 RepID=A0A1R3G9G4_COCAP|nr:hypothetical protein CCACVL1_27654 [Corchorus capsularis]